MPNRFDHGAYMLRYRSGGQKLLLAKPEPWPRIGNDGAGSTGAGAASHGCHHRAEHDCPVAGAVTAHQFRDLFDALLLLPVYGGTAPSVCPEHSPQNRRAQHPVWRVNEIQHAKERLGDDDVVFGSHE